MHYKKMILWRVLNIFLLITAVSAEVYSSLFSLKAIIGAERDIPVMINDYVEKELERLDYLKKFAQKVKEHDDIAIRDGERAIRHPINVFLLIKKMTTDWKEVVRSMQSNSADIVIRNVTRQRIIKRITYPTEEDLLGAAIGLLRLQDTYQMDTKHIADGKILNSQMRIAAFTAGDCFEIGRAAYSEYDYYHTIMWMQEARGRVEKEPVPTANLEDILEYLAFSLYEQGNLKRALLLMDELYRMNPDHPRANENVRNCENLLESDGVQNIDMRRDIPPTNNRRDENDLDEGIRLMYEALCRQEVLIDTKAQSQLYCYYKMDRPYLRLAPFKVEIVRQNSLAVLFYNIISDDEARIIQLLAMPKLKRFMILNSLTGKSEPISFRVAKRQVTPIIIVSWRINNEFILSARLRPMEHEIIKRIDRRLELATNLEIETAEDLGKGDQYFEKLGTGNRIATILIYMTEPEIGGRTVFMTNLKISVPYVKNAALFWYNLMRSGEVDMRSRHAACPVLTGMKWAANKWFHERGQEWRRPCGLNQFDQERYVGDLEAPESKHNLNIRSEAKKPKKMHRKH
uniref:procollagen-proline 4-dioxygenase n=1 Tax=Onchocerca volvulus TaxID=6282 RepID=A0A8R1XPL3_ONCVO